MTDSPSVAPPETVDQPPEASVPVVTPGDEGTTPAGEAPDFFGDNFDPATLDDPRLKQAYDQMRADYTRKTQTVAEQRKAIEAEQALIEALKGDDEHARAQALEALGYTFDQTDEGDIEQDEPVYESEEAELRARLEAIEAERTAEKQAAQHAQQLEALNQSVEQQFTQLQDSHQRDIPASERELAVMLAVTSPPGKDGAPDIVSAFDRLQQYGQARIDAYVQSKNAPSPPQPGQPGEHAPDLSDRDQRIAHMARMLESETANP